MKWKDITGQRFGRLVALRPSGTNSEQMMLWVCQCDCGPEAVIVGKRMRQGNTRSCGCLGRESRSATATTHGMSQSSEFMAWINAKERCFTPKNKNFANYGARGISMYPEWRHDFSAFFAHIGPKPSASHTLERINNDGNYEPGNVKWALRAEQHGNQRGPRQRIFRDINGKRVRLIALAQYLAYPHTPPYLGYRLVRALQK